MEYFGKCEGGLGLQGVKTTQNGGNMGQEHVFEHPKWPRGSVATKVFLGPLLTSFFGPQKGSRVRGFGTDGEGPPNGPKIHV